MELGRECGDCEACHDIKDIPQCEWLEGWGELDDIPSQSGVLLDRVLFGRNSIGAIVANPLQPGAESTQEGQSAVCTASRVLDLPVVVLNHAGEGILYIVGKGIQ